jgi:MoxR-like ATPase
MDQETRAAARAPALLAGEIVAALENVVVGQRAAAEGLLAAYLAGGHALIEGIPGIGKTLLVRALAACLGSRFCRIQFTPDLMPTDITGANVFDPPSGSFRLLRGPLFTQVLMADEVNRTPPKTQSALLEAMQEGQVTIDGVSHPLEADFFVAATQNPIDFEGTYPLPEAQLDRFLLRVEMGLPDAAFERELFRRAAAGELSGSSGPGLPGRIATPAEAQALRGAARAVHVSAPLLDYLARLVGAVRASPHLDLAVSPRGALALLEAARAAALLAQRDFATPDDFKALLVPCWAHRLILKSESELEGRTARGLLLEIADATEVPR